MNMHFKDKDGKHRIVAGDLEFIQDQEGLKKMIKVLKLNPSDGPILGVIRGGKLKTPDRFSLPSF